MRASYRVALGGICTGLAVLMLLLSGVFPMMEYAFPAIAGLFLVPLVLEVDCSTALAAYAAAAVLGILLSPNREGALLFLFFFGYYPVVKAKLEGLQKALMEWILKFVIFNAAVLVCYAVLLWVLDMQELAAELQASAVAPAMLLLLGNGVFFLYDLAMTRMISLYCTRIRPHLPKS